MPVHPDAPLRKVTVNLYDADVVLAEELYGHGWSTHLRAAWHRYLTFDQVTNKPSPRTLGDLLNDPE